MMVALASSAMGIPAGGFAGDPLDRPRPDFHPNPKQRRGGKGQNNRRGKGKRSAPKKRPNRLIISKRARRKHRRAA